MKTKAFIDFYKGYKIFAIWAVNDQGVKTGKAPVVSLGVRKAKALANHQEEFQAFLQQESEQQQEEKKVEVPSDIGKLF